MNTYFLGIDIAKASFDVALQLADGKLAGSGHFSNDKQGFAALRKWLKGLKATAHNNCVHACMEATGRYGLALAGYLHAAGWMVSIVNPQRISAYGASKLRRNKTDPLDALLIADFCATQKLQPWTPPSPAQRHLQELVRFRESLIEDRQRAANRLAAGVVAPDVRKAIKRQLALFDEQLVTVASDIKACADQDPDLKHKIELIDSIPGFALTTATLFAAELPPIDQFENANQVAAYIGVVPTTKVSGTSVRKRSRMSKIGNGHLRAALYFPALAAWRFDPTINAYAQRLLDAGKPKSTVRGAIMHKLVRYVYAVLKHDTPYNKDFSATISPTEA
jgi:transposase